MSDKMLQLFGQQHIRGVKKILGGVAEAYDENDPILDATIVTEIGNLDLWAVYQNKVDRETLRKLLEESTGLKKARQSQFTFAFGLSGKSDSEVKPTTYPVLFVPKVKPQPPTWIGSHEEILRRLETENASSVEYEEALLIAEITDFSGTSEIDRLLNALAKYISNNRFESNDNSIMLLGCAIRKYAMNMSEEHFNDYVKWLQPTNTKILDSMVELELVKGINSRLSYSGVSFDGDKIDEAVSIISEVCEEYSSRRRLLKENHASIALEANHAIVLLHLLAGNAEKAEKEFVRAKRLDPDWVAELIVEQLEETAEIMKVQASVTSDKILELLKK